MRRSSLPFSTQAVFALLVTITACGTLDGPAVARDPLTEVPHATLAGLAILPAKTFAPGPRSGTRLDPANANGVELPFPSQPVQGISAILDNGDGTLLAMADNGFGSLENSADFELRVYTLRPDFKGSRGIEVLSYITLRDPDRQLPFAITNAFTDERILTGADLDIESMQRATDGSLWFGDEFGPFIVHTDGTGRILEPPIALPDHERGGDLRSPQSPLDEEGSVVRVMNALSAHAAAHGSPYRPILSPDHALLADGNPSTFVASRDNPPGGSGLTAASSEIVDVAAMHQAGFAVIPYTVNELPRMLELMKLKVDGLISDRPDLLREAVEQFDADGDQRPDYLDAEGLVDATKLDVQGHRGGRDLRPENTLPAFEVALDNLVTTLELDVGISLDGRAVLSHDAQLLAQKCRRADGAAYTTADEVLIKNLTTRELQAMFVCDKLFRGPQQKNAPELSPVAFAYALSRAMPHAYAPPTLDEVFDFVRAYSDFYETGAGKGHPDARRRARNAKRVRFNVETKLNPRLAYASLTAPADRFVSVVADLVESAALVSRVTIQSFDYRTLLGVQLRNPRIQTAALFGDFPVYADSTLRGSDRGTNLQDEDGKPSPWLGGLPWPYRVTRKDHPARVQASGGIEGMALSKDGARLIPILEKPLSNSDRSALALELDLARRAFTGRTWSYPFEERAKAVADFTLTGAAEGLVIERDDTQGDLTGLKRVYAVKLGPNGGSIDKRLVTDLLHIADPRGLSKKMSSDDVGVGATFAMPFITVESIAALDDHRILVMNDNNFPFSKGRHVASGKPDDSELVLIEIARPSFTPGSSGPPRR